jgi:hypothetical protein
MNRCLTLQWTDVRSALEAVSGYTYAGTDSFVANPLGKGPGGKPLTLSRTTVGTYRAPDQSAETSTWALGDLPADNVLVSAVLAQFPDFIQVGNQRWERVSANDALWQLLPAPSTPAPQGGHLDNLLASLNIAGPWASGRPSPDDPSECLFADASPSGAAASSGSSIYVSFQASLLVNPATALPTSLQIDRVGTNGILSRLDLKIDVTTVPSPISAPAANQVTASPSPRH